MNAWVEDLPLKYIAFKAIMIMSSLLLQKSSKKSKAKDHIAALERRIKHWQAGNTLELLKEFKTIQNSLQTFSKPKTIGEISKRFAEMMHKGNVNGAIKLITNNIQNGILPLNNETLNVLRQKHPTASEASQDVLLPDIPEIVHPVKFENITADTVRKAAIKTKGAAGPSGIDADGWRRLFVSNSLGASSTDLCKAFAAVIRKLCTIQELSISLEAFLACRLIPLDKNHVLRPIGVDEVLRIMAGKAVVSVIRE